MKTRVAFPDGFHRPALQFERRLVSRISLDVPCQLWLSVSTTPWLLFIITKAQPGLVTEFAREGFMRALDTNTAASPEFRDELAGLVESTAEQLDDDLEAAWNGQDQRFLRLFCTGLGKWLLALLSDAAPPRELVLLSSCYYQ